LQQLREYAGKVVAQKAFIVGSKNCGSPPACSLKAARS